MTRRTPAPRSAAFADFLLMLALLGGCGGSSGPGATGLPASGAAASAPNAAASAPPVSVTTLVARLRDLPVVLEATGTVVPVASVEVRPQVSSVVAQVHVREGQFVRAGQLLFTLDARADEANVAKARAQMLRDEAALADTRRQLTRSRELLAQNFVSQGAVDSNQAQVDAQSAAVAADRAALAAAGVALAYGRVLAPSAGRVGAITVFPGSAVQANQTTLLTVTQLDPADVAFSVPQRHLPDVLGALQDGGAEVRATLPDGGASVAGRLQFVDNAVDAASGAVKVKARFANPDSRLWPGAFVNVDLTVRTIRGAVVVPQASIIQSPRGAVVYVVEQGRAAMRPVQLLAAQGDDAAVSGVRAGERVVLDGRQNLRPGAAVAERAGAGAASASTAASAGGPP